MLNICKVWSATRVVDRPVVLVSDPDLDLPPHRQLWCSRASGDADAKVPASEDAHNVPPPTQILDSLPLEFESSHIHVAALVVANYHPSFSHHLAKSSLGQWLKEQGIPPFGVSTPECSPREYERWCLARPRAEPQDSLGSQWPRARPTGRAGSAWPRQRRVPLAHVPRPVAGRRRLFVEG